MQQILDALNPLCGLKLARSRNAGSMKNFQFGPIRKHPSGKGTVGQYALHIHCPWRLARISETRVIITGSSDWWIPAEQNDDMDWEDWDKNRPTLSLQQSALAELFQQYDTDTKSWVNISDLLVVQRVNSDDYGGLDIHLSGGYRLQSFPSGKSGEAWRLFQAGTQEPSFSDGRWCP